MQGVDTDEWVVDLKVNLIACTNQIFKGQFQIGVGSFTRTGKELSIDLIQRGYSWQNNQPNK